MGKKSCALAGVAVVLFATPALAIAPIVLGAGIELLTAGSSTGAVAVLPTATATGVSAAWTGIVTALGASIGYMALRDSSGHAVAVPVQGNNAIPAPSAPPTSPFGQFQPDYWYDGRYTTVAAACEAFRSASFPTGFFADGSPAVLTGSDAIVGLTSTVEFQTQTGVCRYTVNGSPNTYNIYAATTQSSSCPAGYTQSGSMCNLSDPRQAMPDNRCDYAFSGGAWTGYAGDDCTSLGGTVNGATIEVSGKDTYGNPVQNQVTRAGGQTTLRQRVQVPDGAGNSTVVNKTVTFDSQGNVTNYSQTTTYETLTLNTTNNTYNSNTTGNTAPAPQQQALPTDYAREGTLQGTNQKLDTLHNDLTTESPAPEAPQARTQSEIGDLLKISALDSLRSGIVVPDAACPTFSVPFHLFGHESEHTMDAQCSLAETARPQISSVMLVAWALFALLIVLSA